jgi:hypothetical protein
MTQHGDLDLDQAALIADRLARSSATEWVGIFEDLRRQKRLWKTVHQFNLLLEQPAHHAVAKSALRRIGLEHAG